MPLDWGSAPPAVPWLTGGDTRCSAPGAVLSAPGGVQRLGMKGARPRPRPAPRPPIPSCPQEEGLVWGEAGARPAEHRGSPSSKEHLGRTAAALGGPPVVVMFQSKADSSENPL